MAIDSHMHINNYQLDKPIKAMALKRTNKDHNIEKAINVVINLSTTREAIDLSERHSKLYVAAGIHPLYIENQDLNELFTLADHPRVVAIGEIGLDNTADNYKEQRRFLISQILIANSLKLPVIIHSKNCNFQIVEIFKKIVKPRYGCVFHCFQPDEETLNYLIANDYLVSFSGLITYKNAKRSLEIARIVPDNLFLVETDSPFFPPESLRASVNYSSNLIYVIEKLAEIRGTSYIQVEKRTKENTLRLFPKLN